MFDDLIDQKLPAQILTTLIDKGNVPHALLFSGIEGVGKKSAAEQLAMALNCEAKKKPCHTCRSCKKIIGATHPDIIVIKPSGKMIKISQIRELLHILSRKPYEAKKRVVILQDSDTINNEAGNALLKMLEEPPDNTCFILLTAHVKNMLATIISRCQTIRFNPISRRKIADHLMEKSDITAEKADLIAHLADGDLTKADHMAAPGSRGSWLELRNFIVNGITDIIEKSTGPCLLYAFRLFQKKDKINAVFHIMKTCFRDAIILKYDPARIIFRDLEEPLARLSRMHTIETMLEKIDAVTEAERAVQSNANLRLTLEVLMIRMSRV